MNFLAIIEISVSIVFILTMITQVIIPLWSDRPIFPILNKSRTKLTQKVIELNELQDLERINEELIKRLARRNARIAQMEQELKDTQAPKPVSTETVDSVEISINPVKE